MGKVIAIANQKGGVGKTTTTANLGVGLVNNGKKVLLIDCDPQGSLTESLGYQNPDRLDITLCTLIQKSIRDEPIGKDEGILHHEEGIDLVPANIELSGMETALVNLMSRERKLKDYVDTIKENYDYVIIDCSPTLTMLTINALVAADEVVIPTLAEYLPAKGLQELLRTVKNVKRQINPDLKINGILLTMVDNRTNYSKQMSHAINITYGGNVNIYKTQIPKSVRVAETAAVGKSIYAYDKNGKAAEAYRNFTKEVLDGGKQRNKHKSDLIR